MSALASEPDASLPCIEGLIILLVFELGEYIRNPSRTHSDHYNDESRVEASRMRCVLGFDRNHWIQWAKI